MDDSSFYHLVYIPRLEVMYAPQIWYHRISEVTTQSLCETLSSPHSLSSLLTSISTDRHLWPLWCEALPISEIPSACSPSGLVLIVPPTHDLRRPLYHMHVYLWSPRWPWHPWGWSWHTCSRLEIEGESDGGLWKAWHSGRGMSTEDIGKYW